MNNAESQPWVYYRSAREPAGEIVTRDKVCISPLDRGFMLADGVYEVIRSYDGRLFRAEEHLARLQVNLDAVRIRLEDVGALATIAAELLRRNGLERADATAYVQVTRGAAQRNLAFPAGPAVPTVYVEANRLAMPGEEAEKGIACITVPDVRWQRCDIKSIGLLPNVLARQAAIDKGAGEALFVRDGIITEGTHTNVFGVREGSLLTHPADGHILGGITRAAVLELCRTLGVPVSEVPIRAEELAMLDELFLACTTAEVLPVVAVDGTPIGTARPGPITRRLQAAFRDYVEQHLK